MNFQILSKNIDYNMEGLPIECLISQEKQNFNFKMNQQILKDGTEGNTLNLFLSSIFLGINLSTILIDAEPNVVLLE